MIWHIVYLSYESKSNGRNYIGKHSTSDLHDQYLGSFSDKSFSPDSRIVLGVFNSSEAATQAEIQWQRVFQVVPDPEFANRSYQTSAKFDTTGVKMSEEFRLEKSEKYSGQGNPNFGKETPQLVKDKIARSLTGQTFTPERKEKQSIALRGNSNKKGKPQPQAAIESAAAKNRGRKNTPETIKKMKESAKARWAKHREFKKS
jgi:hypothetical protein